MQCISGLFNGVVVETRTESWTGPYLYSDYASSNAAWDSDAHKDTTLNNIVRIPVLGILGGIIRMALSIIHTIGHLVAAVVTGDKGHLYHAAKGGCEFIRGAIETLPGIGRIFAFTYDNPYACNSPYPTRSWWIIKIYNPEKPDGVDEVAGHWLGFPEQHYIKA